MSNTQLTGTLSPSVSKLTNLKHIALWNSPLTGDIPDEFWDMTWLERIYFGTNQQGGEISPKIGEFTNLNEFWISGSNLQGTIPAELGNAGSTTLINLYENKLEGQVPDEFTQLSNLKTLNIQNNELDYLPNLNPLDSLQVLDITDNRFTYADIISNLDLITTNTSQKPLGDSLDIGGYTFEALRIDPQIEFVEGQQYEWFLDSVPLSNGHGHYYDIDQVLDKDAGTYQLLLTHPDVPDLVLSRMPVVLSLDEGDPPKPEMVKVISPNGDGINDEATIKNIEFYPEHRVLIYNVLGKLIYETTNYDNINNPFVGISNVDGARELPSGTYYYLVDVEDNKKNGTGFFVMKKQ